MKPALHSYLPAFLIALLMLFATPLQSQTKWSEFSTTWPLASGDKIVGLDISDTTMGASGTNKATTLTALTTYFSAFLQPIDPTLTALAGATTGADVLSYWSGSDTLSSTTLSSFARGVLDDADAPTFRSTIGAGTVTTLSVVSSGGISGSVATATTTPAITLSISGLNASTIADGSVSNTEFQYLGAVTSDIQTQFDNKSHGGNGAADNGKYLIFNTDGSIDATLSVTAESADGISSVSVLPTQIQSLNTVSSFTGTLSLLVADANRTWDMPTNASGIVVLENNTTTLTNKTYDDAIFTGAWTMEDGTRQTFNPDATNAGLNVGSIAGDPSAPSNGDLWYDSTANELTARINGASVALGGGSSGITVGGTTITSGTSGRVAYNNAGVYGEKSVSGTGDVVLQTTPTLLGEVTYGTAGWSITSSGAFIVNYYGGTRFAVNNTECSSQMPTWYFDQGAHLILSSSGSSRNTGINAIAAGVIRVTDGNTGGGGFEFPQVASLGTPSSNSARIGAKDVSGTAEIFVKDEAGNETQISPHAGDAPEWLSDESTYGPDRIVAEFQYYTGRVRFTNESRRARLMELTVNAVVGSLTDKAKLDALTPQQRKVTHEESFEEYNARRGLTGKKALKKLKWADVQKDQRDASVAKREEWIQRKAKHATEQAMLPEEKRTEFPEPEPILTEVKPAPDFLKP